MSKKKGRRRRAEYLIRSIEVSSVHVHMSVRVQRVKFGDSGGAAWMEVRGRFDEPVKGRTDVVISVHEVESETSDGRPTAIGHLVQMRPECRIVSSLPTKQFDRAWTLAASGKLTHAWLSMTTPHYNSAEVPSISFANEPIE